MAKRVQRVAAREGYDLWSDTYDQTPNPVVTMDSRITTELLEPRAGERILDAGCGTGRNFGTILRASGRPVGIDFSEGMLHVARRKHADVPLVCADMERGLPLVGEAFDAVLCALVGEHLSRLAPFFLELNRVLKPGRRMLFSVYHPEMARAGIEANFERHETEFRLGAVPHSTEAYVAAIAAAGFAIISIEEFRGDAELTRALPSAKKYEGFPLLLVLRAHKR